jgi:flavin-dependent dehydrogenase
MNPDADIVVVGGGPAGAAAAISAAQNGLHTVLLDDRRRSDDQPGETLHPAVEPLFRKLGVDCAVKVASTIRHEGHWVTRGERRSFLEFGRDQTGLWRGFQIRRNDLRAILAQKAIDTGVYIKQVRAIKPVFRRSKVFEVETSGGVITCRILIDASGATHWLARVRCTPIAFLSPPLVAWYGWAISDQAFRFAQPNLTLSNRGWCWIAQIDSSVCAWARLNFSNKTAVRLTKPSILRDFKQVRRERGVDVTWRMLATHAGDGFFHVGDAGGVLDPAASHGVLRALLTGMAAAWCSVRVLRFGHAPLAEAASYSRWVEKILARDAAVLRMLYQDQPSSFAGAFGIRVASYGGNAPRL